MITIKQIEDFSCSSYHTTIEEVKNKEVARAPSEARRLIMYLLFRFTKMQTPEISDYMGVQEGVSVRAFKMIKTNLTHDKNLKEIVQNFESKYVNY